MTEESNNRRRGLLETLRHPLAFYGLVVLVVESIIAIAATLRFADNEVILFWIFLILILALVFTVGVVSFIVIRYPRHLMGKFEQVTDAILRGMSDFDKKTILQIYHKGVLEYSDTDRDLYKDLRNQGLVRTSNRKAMRHDTRLVLTGLGSLIAEELKSRKSL